LVVTAILAILAGMLLPAVSKTRIQGQSAVCMSNHRQLVAAWSLYTRDYNDACANNFTIADVLGAITSKRFDNWANNVMTWSTGGIDGQSVTNLAWVRNGVLFKYTSSAVGVYQCPADVFVSPAQRRLSWTRRLRSVSMNALFGRSDRLSSGATGRSWSEGGAWRQYLKTSQVPNPSVTWLMLDEHPDGINDGFFVNPSTASQWSDLPASYHGGGCVFSFADGHVELKPWTSATSKYPVRFSYMSRPFDAAGRKDFAWYKERTGWVPFQ